MDTNVLANEVVEEIETVAKANCMPALLTGAVSIFCPPKGCSINKRRDAALAAVYSLSMQR